MINRKSKGKGKKGGAELQERDGELLRELELWGVLGLGQIDGLVFHKGLGETERARLLFNEYGENLYRLSGYKRLQDLKKSGHVEAHFYRDFPMVFTLTSRGHRALKAAKLARLPGFKRSVSGHLIEHEILVNAVGLVLSRLHGLTVRTIRERTDWNSRGGWSHTTSRSRIPDLWISDPAEPKAVEVELNKKATQLYPDIWGSYRASLPGRAVVLYLTNWPSGPDFVRRQAARLSMPFIYVCDLAEFRASAGRCTFANCEGRSLRLVPASAASILSAPKALPSDLETVGGAA
ncbi:MAG: hypothetical protein HY921_03360 [Elusimicrobia bacterium]|nr:hypothetical protein [Elusimicrobiota bacterium]